MQVRMRPRGAPRWRSVRRRVERARAHCRDEAVLRTTASPSASSGLGLSGRDEAALRGGDPFATASSGLGPIGRTLWGGDSPLKSSIFLTHQLGSLDNRYRFRDVSQFLSAVYPPDERPLVTQILFNQGASIWEILRDKNLF